VTGRSNVPPIESAVLELDVPTIWDGRFLCQAKRNGVRIEPAFGHLQKLRQFAEFKEIFDLPKAVRGSLPIYFHEGDPIGFGACDSEFILVLSQFELCKNHVSLLLFFGVNRPI